MKVLKRISIALALVLVIGIFSIPAFAADKEEKIYNTPIEIVAGITGRTVESVEQEIRDSGKRCITIAYEAGKLNDFKEEEVKLVSRNLDTDVADGIITRQSADDIITRLKDNQKNYEDYAKGTYTSDYGDGYGYGHGHYNRNYNYNYDNESNQSNSSYGRGYGRGRHHNGGYGYGRNYTSDSGYGCPRCYW